MIASALPIALKVLRSPWLYIGLLVLAVAWYRHDAGQWKRRAQDEQTAHATTVASYRNAQVAAQALEDARIEAETARTARISENAIQSYRSRLDALSGAYSRLRAQAGSAGSSPGGKPVSGVSPSPGGIAETTGADGLSLAERFECSAYATQLDELIGWTVNQASGSRP